jgi:hypothetical protein
MGQGSAGRARRSAFAAGKRRGRLAVVVVATGLTGMCLAQGTAAASNSFPDMQRNPRGKFLGVVPSASAKQHGRLSARRATPPLRYHNGPVQHSSRVYSILWSPPGFGFPAGYGNVIKQYFNRVAADSFKTTNVYAVNTQYYDVVGGHKRYISYDVTNGGTITDTTALPPSGCPNYKLSNGTTTGACVTDQQQINEINRVINSRGLPRGIGVEYFLFMPLRLGSCFDSTFKDGCSDRAYCAYHSQIGIGSNVTLYASMPYAATPACDPGAPTPHGTAAEAVLNVTSHEHNETITDPTGGGWYDVNGYENGDKCSFDFGTTTFNGFGYYNQVIDGGQYLLQREWSNLANGCVQRSS